MCMYGNSMGGITMAFLRTLIVLCLLPFLFGFHLHRESWYQNKWCNGDKEVRMIDRTRVDCLTETHAIEYDFGHRKWYESVGQALHYGRLTGITPGVVLIIENDRDLDALDNLLEVIKEYELNIKVWKCDTESITLVN